MGKVAAVVFVAMLAGGCNPWEEYRLTEAERVRAGWYQPSALALTPRYCYRTLARVDCFDEPQPGIAGRRVGDFNALVE